MSNTSFATIAAEDLPNYSKFTAKGLKWVNPADHDEGTTPVTFNINSDVTVPKFWSENKGLTLLYDDIPMGFDSFRGNIGGGIIFIKTGKGVTIKGPIQGGPDEAALGSKDKVGNDAAVVENPYGKACETRLYDRRRDPSLIQHKIQSRLMEKKARQKRDTAKRLSP
ncbi:hypothetical protein BDP27DRAFT_1408284 [Rhodocollybia butyracea]|uniref:Uncharacterized protein n=1 Tax=Rhodocollybia butyracea TaxID=206335 RepID=A0A9P5PA97_9AGAR|nr:hypothetical protein BDP27DRAFT_1408284 [Rhodocollybia butyracea]